VKILCALGRHNYGNPARGEGYEYVNFLPALRNMGHEVIFFESFSRDDYSGFVQLNKKLLEVVQLEDPDVVLCVLLGYEIWLETLQMIRATSRSVLINWSTDDSWKYEQFSRYVASVFDIYATTYSAAMRKAKRDGYDNFVLTQWGASSTLLQPPLLSAQCRYHVSFIGTCYGNRSQWVAGLAELGIVVECFGYGWKNGPVSADDIPRIIQKSIISLNLSDSGTHWNGALPTKSRQLKARIFEVPGSGGFLLTERADGLDAWYEAGKELEVFDDLPDLARKIRYYLDHPQARDRIAEAGYQRTHHQHTYEMRFAGILNQVAHLAVAKKDKVFTLDADVFGELARKHRVGALMAMVGMALRAPFILIWGRERGPRAARRLLFELSWRLFGRRVYSVSGWPGRLFYRES